MMKDNRVAVVYVLDERSMCTADNLGAAERNLAATAHMEEATKESCSGGGCPSFCLWGMTTSCPHQQTHKREHLTQLEGSLHTHKGKLELLHQEHSFFSTHLKSACNSRQPSVKSQIRLNSSACWEGFGQDTQHQQMQTS